MMTIGVPKEIKTEEYRVGMTPAGVEQLAKRGHQTIVQVGAGIGSGFTDEEYRNAGAILTDDVETIYQTSDMIVKVKEPLPEEYPLLRENQVVFTFLHLAPNRELTNVLMEKKVIAIGYETVEEKGRLPLLEPMSEIAGRMAPIMGGYFLSRPQGGEGVLLGGASGVLPANVLVLGGGMVGMNAARTAAGLGSNVVVMDIKPQTLRFLEETKPPNVSTLISSPHNIQTLLPSVDLVVGAVLIAGARTPSLITRDMLHFMKKGSLIVDVSIDQGGCVETSRPTTHENPVFEVEGIMHYCVTNMPGAYPRTSTLALTNATFPFVVELADQGWKEACRKHKALAKGVNTAEGHITCKAVAEAHGFSYLSINNLLE